MTNVPPPRSAGSFHEWPLVVFTTLAVTGAGLLATPLVAWLAGGTTAPAAGAVWWGAVLLGVAILVSLAHLGRPLRAPLASLGIGRSRLSAEIVVAGLALLFGVVTALGPGGSPVLDFATPTAAIALLVTLGFVYNLPGQQTWRGAVAWMPLTEGLAFSVAALSTFGAISQTVAVLLLAAVLAADLALLVARWMALARPMHLLSPRFPALFARRTLILASRLALVDLLPPLCLALGLPFAALAASALGILVDRVGFYGFASQHTTEAEIERVERIMAG